MKGLSWKAYSTVLPEARLDGVDQHLQGRCGRGRQIVGGAVVVLNLLQRQDVRRLEVGHDLLRQRVELGRAVGGIEVLDVVVGDRRAGWRCRRACVTSA